VFISDQKMLRAITKMKVDEDERYDGDAMPSPFYYHVCYVVTLL